MKQLLINIIQKLLYKSSGFKLVKQAPADVSIDCYTTIQQLLKFHKPVHLCDIGANDGLWTNALYPYDPALRSVVFFEPQKKYHTALEALPLGNASKTIFPFGLGETDATLTIKGGNHSASFLDFDQQYQDTYVGTFLKETETVAVRRLDDVYQENNLPFPDVVKIDVQGFELPVLKGGLKVLSNAHYLILELSTEPFYKGQDSIGDVLNYLSDIGFVLIDIGFIWREQYDQNKKILQFDGVFKNKHIQ